MISRQNGRTCYDNTHYFCNKFHVNTHFKKKNQQPGADHLNNDGYFLIWNRLLYSWKLSPHQNICKHLEVRFPFCHDQLKIVQPLLQLYCSMHLHVFGTGGSVESLATRYFLLSTKICWWWYLRFILDALSSDQVLILGSSNVSLETICSRMQCLKRLPLVE